MAETAKLGPWVRRFLLEHLIGERNVARDTQRSYRDTLSGTAQESERLPERLVFSEKGLWLA